MNELIAEQGEPTSGQIQTTRSLQAHKSESETLTIGLPLKNDVIEISYLFACFMLERGISYHTQIVAKHFIFV